MMEEPILPIVPDEKQKRPGLLTVLCILTFVGSGMNFFSSIIIATFYGAFTEVARTLAEKFSLPGIDLILESPPAFFFTSGVLYLASLAGALLMWNLRKTGFHIYTISQILLILAPMYFLKLQGPSLFDIIFSGMFVVLYAVNLKNLH
jgi:hypothetical protein